MYVILSSCNNQGGQKVTDMFLVDSILSTIQEHIKDIQSLNADDIPMVKDMEQVSLDAIGSMSAQDQ